jgi:DNA repair protein RecN (Recombination protein N)
MLEELHVSDLALIEDVWIEFAPGMTVLTGETGAGKTALVGALKLLVGERADSGMVRTGSDGAVVEGRFAFGGAEVVARRRLGADGRSRCALDGSMATVGSLAETLGPLVDLHGQHEHQALLQSSRHAGYLDRYAGADALDAVESYREAREEFRATAAALEELEARIAETAKTADYLRFVAREIESADVREGEDAELEARLPGLSHADKLTAACAAGYDTLKGEQGASDALSQALAALDRVSGLDPALDAHIARLGAILAECDDVAGELRTYAEAIEHDPAVLDEVQARLAVLAGLAKKYGPALADVIETGESARTQLAALDSSDEELAEARVRLDRARGALEEAAVRMREVRREHVAGFETDLAAAVADLHMAGARFEVAFEELPFESWGPDGPERVEFLFAPGAGESARPLAKIASGGELSRVMLALKGVLGSADDVPVLVFDEVDAGIGGATALSVGTRLAALARDHQVLVVTHLAQVAAYADHHLVVRKEAVDGRTVTRVEPVAGEDRVAEVARMLAGEDTEASRAHAAELLGQARSVRERSGA